MVQDDSAVGGAQRDLGALGGETRDGRDDVTDPDLLPVELLPVGAREEAQVALRLGEGHRADLLQQRDLAHVVLHRDFPDL